MIFLRGAALAVLFLVAPSAALAARPGSHLLPPSPSEINPLVRIERAVDREVRSGRIPIVVFNIDGCVLDNRPRSQAILRDFVASSETYSAISDSVQAIGIEEIDYFVVDSFRGAGIHNLFILESALKFWSENFFSNKYVRHDMPVGGAVGYINRLHDAGALIVYISGRGAPNMWEGTTASLQQCGFPVGTSRTLLVMKPTPREDNIEYKRREYARIARLGRVIGAFENDPRAGEAMARAFPQADIVLVRRPHPRAEARLPPDRTATIDRF